MLTPDAFVADVHSFLALAGCFHDRAVHLDGRLIEEPIVLLLPDVQTHLIERLANDQYGRDQTGDKNLRRRLGSREQQFLNWNPRLP